MSRHNILIIYGTLGLILMTSIINLIITSNHVMLSKSNNNNYNNNKHVFVSYHYEKYNHHQQKQYYRYNYKLNNTWEAASGKKEEKGNIRKTDVNNKLLTTSINKALLMYPRIIRWDKEIMSSFIMPIHANLTSYQLYFVNSVTNETSSNGVKKNDDDDNDKDDDDDDDDDNDDENSNTSIQRKKRSSKKSGYVMNEDRSYCQKQPTYISPNCNIFHEYTNNIIDSITSSHQQHKLGTGGRRDAYKLSLIEHINLGSQNNDNSFDKHQSTNATNNTTNNIVFKTSFFGRVSEKGLDLNRKDAIVADALTFSNYAVNIYGFCGESTFSELATYGDLYQFGGGLNGKKRYNFLKYNITSTEIFHMAYEAAIAIRDLHSIQFSSLYNTNGGIQIHRDIRPWNYLITTTSITENDNNQSKKYQLKIHDFNAGRYMSYTTNNDKSTNKDEHSFSLIAPSNHSTTNTKSKHLCLWKSKSKCNQHRSPEECIGAQPITEKVDIWGLGNVLYYLYTRGTIVYQDVKNNVAANAMVKKGIRPTDHDIHLQLVTNIKHEYYHQRSNSTTIPKYKRMELYKNISKTIISNSDDEIATIHSNRNKKNPLMKVLYDAIVMCHTVDPTKRPSAQDVVNFLQPHITTTPAIVIEVYNHRLGATFS